MTFTDWLLSRYDNPSIAGQWKFPHIFTLLLCIGIIISLAFIFRKRSEKTRKIVLYVLVGLILFFEISRRIINFIKMEEFTLNDILYNLLPRPWCAISCWLLIFSPIVNKKWFYNLVSFSGLVCAIIFFSYPGAGFNNKYIEFENLYSIATHSLILISTITLITLKFTDFRFVDLWKSLIGFVCIFLYAFFEMYVLNIADDPLYFMPGNDVQEILGLSYYGFLMIYILFFAIFISSFYLINDREVAKKKFRQWFKNNDDKK